MRRETRIAAAVFAAIPLFVIGAALLATWILSEGASPLWRLPFRVLCHGMARRCLTIWNTPMPICARCLGIYAGMLAGLTAFATGLRLRERVARFVLFGSAALLALDGLTQLAGLRESTNALRLATGVAAGLAFGLWVLAAVRNQKPETRDQKPETLNP